MRKLASIQKIESLVPIPNAERIEVAIVLGWAMVTQKSNNFKAGDKVLFAEPDSFLPICEKLEFLRKSSFRKMADGSEGFRLKTIRLRGQISQGLILPLSEFPELELLEVGTDVSEILGVKKWEPPIPACLSGIAKGNFPSFIPKTDETRIQACPQVLERHKGKRFYYTEKIDGSSCSIYHRDGEFGVCSRGMDLVESEENSFWKVANIHGLKDKLPKLGNMSVQGELYGEGIQGNKYKIKGQDLRLFNVYNIDKGDYVDVVEFVFICNQLGLAPVPCLGEFTLNHTIEDLVKLAMRESELADVKAEGIVIRPVKEERDQDLGRLSFKVINPEFLLEHDE